MMTEQGRPYLLYRPLLESNFFQTRINKMFSDKGKRSKCSWEFQIPPDLVVKLQPTDIIDIILCLIKRLHGAYMAWGDRNARSELLSTAAVQWSTTKSDGMWGQCACPTVGKTKSRNA
jgi:hypothetical protein